VAVITEDHIRQLAAVRGQQAPVTSCYLDVDGRRHVRRQDYELQLDSMLRAARPQADGDPSVAADLQRISDFVRAGVDRSSVRGLALFSCAAHGFWQAVQLPVPVRDQLVVNHSAYVRPLELIVDDYERFAVLLADRQRARLFVFELGELVEFREEFEQLPRHDDDGGDLTRDQVQGHAAARAHQHLRHAARVAFEVWQRRPVDRLVIGAPQEIAAELEAQLHPYLRERVVARLSVPVSASHDEIRQAAMGVEEQIERRKEAEAVARLREAVGAGRRGVAGLSPTLQALVERRVDVLLVSSGYVAPGWRCTSCGFLAARGRRCPACGGEMMHVQDVVDEAVAEALAQKCRVEMCSGNADLDVLGRIGALLRF
jgi:peptide chain release factor subunit 1